MKYNNIQEQTLWIDLPETGGKKVKGVLRGSFDGDLIIMVHGLPGDGNELLQFLGARYLYERGFSTLRLSLYPGGGQGRDLIGSSIDTHAEGFDTVVDYIKKQGAKRVFAIGHSYGGLTIIKSQSQIDSAVLWDPTHGSVYLAIKSDPSESKPRHIDDLVVYNYGNLSVLPHHIEEQNMNLGNTTSLADKPYSILIISAGKGIMVENGAMYAGVGNNQQIIIDDAHHQFDDSDEVIEQLLSATANWLDSVQG